ncbi:MAG: ATP-binding protein [Oligoflexia bacterium]|nr:ATP-binding protein [Oligoflexia bacterium]
MLDRAARRTIQHHLAVFPAVALIGPRQVGKTTLAKMLLAAHEDALYLDLELPSHRDRLAHPETYLAQHSDRLVVLDEVQNVPDLFPVLRSLIDMERRPGRFLLLGSASPHLLQRSSETLAGRLAIMELPPVGLSELPPEVPWRTNWWRGGFPPSLLAPDDQSSRTWLSSFTRTYIEREIPAQGVRVSPQVLSRCISMLAYRQGQIWNAEQLATSLGVSGKTVASYRDHLIDAFLVRELRPFHANLGKRLVKKPKGYIRDSGILHTLLRVPSFDALQGHPMLGQSFEGYVIEQACNSLPSGLQPAFWGVHGGGELDLLLHDGANAVAAIEVKYGDRVRPKRGFYNAIADLNIAKAWVVHPGRDRWVIDDHAEAIGVEDLPQALASL